MHHQVGSNPLRHSLKRSRAVVLAKENPDNKAKVKILLLLASMPLPSGKTMIKIKIKKT